MSDGFIPAADAASIPAGDDEWTEGQFEALVTLHMLKPGQVLTDDDCWAIEYTRRDADKVQTNAVDAFDDGRKHGIASIAGKTDVAMFEEIERLKTQLAVEKALCRYYARLAGVDDRPECEVCGGTGKVVEEARTTGANQHSACQRECDECDGVGRLPAQPDPDSMGTDGPQSGPGVNNSNPKETGQ